MRALGISGGWMFFAHAGAAVAVDLTSGDVTDVFDIAELGGQETGWNGITGSEVEQRAALLARSALAADVDPLRSFSVPDTVRASARQALQWQLTYGRAIPLPVVAATPSLVPPRPVQETAQHALALDLDPTARQRAEQLCSGRAVSPHLIEQMQLFFSRHQQAQVSEGDWLSWGGDSGQVWADRTATASDEAQSVIEKLADSDTVDYDTLRLLPRAFSMVASPHTSECAGAGECSCGGSKDSALYPSDRAVTFLGLGGDYGRDWAKYTLRRVESAALAATGYNPDVNVPDEQDVPDNESFDGTVPHVFNPVPENPDFCIYCAKDEQDQLHDPSAVNYAFADIAPDSAHYFSEKFDDDSKCEVCGKASDDTLHQQAALASYYLYKDAVDKALAETAQYWQAQGKPENADAVTSAAEGLAEFTQWVELPPEATVVAVDAELLNNAGGLVDDSEDSGVPDMADHVCWERTGDEENDPLSYYVSYTGDDQLVVDQLYVTDGFGFYCLDPNSGLWTETQLGSPEQVYEIDDSSARDIIQAMLAGPGYHVDLRDTDPSESALMADGLAAVDTTLFDRVAVRSPRIESFADYTPQERSQNARKQVRDRSGRFAKSGSRIVGPDGRAGTVAKINPDTQQVQVNYDDGGQPGWVDAKQVSVTGQSKQAPTNTPQQGDTVNLRGIAAQPRATAHTPKAALKAMLPPMDEEAIRSVINNYPAFIANERAGAAARRAAQQALNRKSRQQYLRQQKQSQQQYERILGKIHAQGKSARHWVDAVYKRILPHYKRTPTLRGTGEAVFARKKQAAPVAPAAPATQTAPAPAAQPITDPSQSDVAPMYIAEVDPTAPANVLDLYAMIPASTQGNQPQLMRYTSGGWIADPKTLRALQGPTPPDVVVLDQQQYDDTLAQVKQFYATPEGKNIATDEAKQKQSVAGSLAYGEYGELIAVPDATTAVDRMNRYWLTGAGAAKIAWDTPGDVTRCQRQLRKYFASDTAHVGYCASLQQRLTGDWPGDRRSVGRRGHGDRGAIFTDHLLSSGEVIHFSSLVAAAAAQEVGIEAPTEPEQVPTELSGSPFVIPVVAPIGVRSGDGRQFAPLSLTSRTLPLPLMWQIQTQQGHDASVIVGRIDSMERAEDGSLVNARGVFDVGPYGQEAERLVRHQFLRGVSVDLDEFEAEAKPQAMVVEREKDEAGKDDVVRIVPDEMTVTNGRVMGVTLVAKPAFQQCTIQLDEEPEEEAMVADGIYIATPITETETEELVRSALTAAGIPLHPPSDWFTDPMLTTATPLTVTDEGRVYGHIATWDTDHIGLPFSTRPPKSRSGYAYFRTGSLRTAEGGDVHVGQITLAGGHAPLEANAAMAVKHYDDTASAFCDVSAGEDSYGIWVAGALRPGVNGDQIRAVRASAPSGDWRPINGRLELVAVCQVNVPGFPVTRARVASGHVFALIAAGTSVLNQLRADVDDRPLSKLQSRVEALEAPQREALTAARKAAVARIDEVRVAQADQVKARFAEMSTDIEAEVFKDYSKDSRDKMAGEGKAMKGGRYPISNASDLKNAIHAYGRGDPKDKPAIRRHIKKRARALGKTDLIPESWSSASFVAEEFHNFAVTDYQSVFRDLSPHDRADYAKQGLAMADGGFPIANVGDLKNAIRAYGRTAPAAQAAVRRHIRKRARAMDKMDLIPASWAAMSTPVQEIAGEIEDLTARMSLISSGVAELAPLDDDGYDPETLESLFARGPGWITNPEATRRIHGYWTHGKGAGKIRWGTDGDFDRCRREVGSEISESKKPEKIKFINAICAQWHHDATGFWPGHAPTEHHRGSHSTIEVDAMGAAVELPTEELNELIAAGGHYPNGEPWDPKQHPRGEGGKFRQVIAELRDELVQEPGTKQAVQGLDVVQQKANQGDIPAAQQAAKGVLDLVDQIAKNTEDAGAVKTLREGYTNLANAVANLPLVFGDLNEKYRFSDLPADLQGLIRDLYHRAESRLEPDQLNKAGGDLESFMSGIDLLSQPEISASLSRILRFLI